MSALEKWVLIIVLLIGAFSGGYYFATGQYEAALANAAEATRVSQHELDVAQQAKAHALGQLVEARRLNSDKKNEAVEKKIDELPTVTTQACEFTPDVLKLLNEAAQ